MKFYYLLVLLFLLFLSFDVKCEERKIEIGKELDELIKEKSEAAQIGIAVISQDNDTISIYGNSYFPMLSVYKFPQSLAVAEFCIKNHISFSDSINIESAQIHSTTYSPLREKYGIKNLRLPISELLEYSIQQSDNNACDILFNLIGGTDVCNTYISEFGFPEIHIKSTEDEMHKDLNLCYENVTTPLEMSRLLSYFVNELKESAPEYFFIGNLLETCQTGLDRLTMGIKKGDILGHKTGTGDINSDGKIIAINDVGYITLKNGTQYFIVVFIKDSSLDYESTSKLIGEISLMVANFFRNRVGN